VLLHLRSNYRSNPVVLLKTRPGLASMEDAVKEAERCLNCPDPTCVLAVPRIMIFLLLFKLFGKMIWRGLREYLPKRHVCRMFVPEVCDVASQCEGSCSWALAGGEPVAIGKLERFVTDHSPVPPIKIISDRGKELSVGISAPGRLALRGVGLAGTGVKVAIYEREAAAGGILQWGIPSYVLPDKVSHRPVQAFRTLAWRYKLTQMLLRRLIESLLIKHDAIIVGIWGSGS